MAVKNRELRKTIKLGIKALIFQEVRLLQLEHSFTPQIVIDEISQSVQETKREIVRLTKSIAQKEKAVVLKRMIRQAIDQEIDEAIQLRKTRCIRCLHGRFYDEEGSAHPCLPVGSQRAQTIGCDKLSPSLRKSCRRFKEISTSSSLGQYLNGITLLYEFRELIDQVNEIWEDYFLGR
jgi:hypothetical protein